MQKILLVEDDQAFRDLYTEILTDAGYEVDSAADGEIGLKKIKQGGYNLIFLDMMLPKMDGLSVLAEVQKSKPTNNGKIIVLSNLSQDIVINEAIKFGADGHIAKHTLNPQEFVAKVQELIS